MILEVYYKNFIRVYGGASSELCSYFFRLMVGIVILLLR